VKYIIKTVSVLLAVVLAAVLSSCGSSRLSYDEARKELSVLAAHVGATSLPVRLDPNEIFDIDNQTDTASLPDISEFPFVVNPITSNFITVYSTSPEIIQAANDFNAAGVTVEGQSVSVGVRSISSALGTNFIVSEKYTPDVLVPASVIYGGMLSYASVPNELIAESTVPGVSGVVVSEKTGVSTFSDLVGKLGSGELSIGYVDPLQDADGLNFILAALSEYDSAQPLSDTAVDGLRKLQNNITYIAYDSAQLKSSFLRGILDGYVLNYNEYKGTSEFKSGYTFVPFGVEQGNPVYTVGELSSLKKQTAQQFAQYCRNAGDKVTDPVVKGYSSGLAPTAAESGQLYSTYRSVRGGSSSTTAVFVADVSGSMAGTPLLKLKTGLRGAISAIDPNNSIGLVTFDTDVQIALPIAPFDAKQQSYFSNAISNMTDGGRTAMFDAIAVALQMLVEYQDKNPDTKLVLFVLTDGDSNEGYTFKKMSPAIAGLQIPVYTIGYQGEANDLHTDVLEELAAINEAYYIDAETDNITYILSSLLSSQA